MEAVAVLPAPAASSRPDCRGYPPLVKVDVGKLICLVTPTGLEPVFSP
jgi:hypothetical protein